MWRQKWVARVRSLTHSLPSVTRRELSCVINFEQNMLFFVKFNPEFLKLSIRRSQGNFNSSVFTTAQYC